MICKPCRWEADGVKEGRFTHAQVAEWHKKRKLPFHPLGHANCLGGCDCKHHDVETT